MLLHSESMGKTTPQHAVALSPLTACMTTSRLWVSLRSSITDCAHASSCQSLVRMTASWGASEICWTKPGALTEATHWPHLGLGLPVLRLCSPLGTLCRSPGSHFFSVLSLCQHLPELLAVALLGLQLLLQLLQQPVLGRQRCIPIGTRLL